MCRGRRTRIRLHTYIYSQTGRPCEVAELVGVLVAETIHPACMCEGGGRGGEGRACNYTYIYSQTGRPYIQSDGTALRCKGLGLVTLKINREPRTFLKVHTRPRLAYPLRCRGY